jgi:ribosomal protein S18 acetylase RimI-like enzyme
MINTLTIYPLQNKDIVDVVNLVNSAYRGQASKKGWTTEADLLKGALRIDEPSLHTLLQKAGAIVLICKSNTNSLVGCVYLQQEGAQLYLGMLTVSPQAQAQGIGKQLLLAAEQYAKKINCNAIVMHVISVRHELIAWYQRHGYQLTGETKPFPSNPKFGRPTQPLEFFVLEKIL